MDGGVGVSVWGRQDRVVDLEAGHILGVVSPVGHSFPLQLHHPLGGLQERAELFVAPGDDVYEGMIVGEHNRGEDIDVNPCKEKKLSNMRAAGKDDNVLLSPIKPFTLEQTINFIREDELVEVTPLTIRMRKAILDSRKRHALQAARKKDQ